MYHQGHHQGETDQPQLVGNQQTETAASTVAARLIMLHVLHV